MKSSFFTKLIFGMLFPSFVFGFFYAFFNPIKYSNGDTHYFFLAIGSSLIMYFFSLGVISWLGVMKNFSMMINSNKYAISLADAPSFNVFFVFSKKYLTQTGLVVRKKLLTWFIIFLGSIGMGFLFGLIVLYIAPSP